MEQNFLLSIVGYTIFFLIWFFMFFTRKDLRRKIMQASIAGGILLVFVEHYWSLKDYWHPPYVLGRDGFFAEDFLFGFFIGGTFTSVYDVFFLKKNEKTEPRRAKISILLMIAAIVSLLIFCNGFGINSIFVSSISALILSAIMIAIRKDLLIPSIVSGLLMVIIIIPMYSVLFNIISMDYWDKYWCLANTKYGVKILGNIPLTELLWYFSWGCAAGIGYEFATGRTKSDYVAKKISKLDL